MQNAIALLYSNRRKMNSLLFLFFLIFLNSNDASPVYDVSSQHDYVISRELLPIEINDALTEAKVTSYENNEVLLRYSVLINC